MSNFGSRLREIRKSKNMNGVTIAQLLCITPQYYYDIEKGKRNLSAEIAVKLADCFSVSLDYLLGRTNDPCSSFVASSPNTTEEGDFNLTLTVEERAAVYAFVEVYRQRISELKRND